MRLALYKMESTHLKEVATKSRWLFHRRILSTSKVHCCQEPHAPARHLNSTLPFVTDSRLATLVAIPTVLAYLVFTASSLRFYCFTRHELAKMGVEVCQESATRLYQEGSSIGLSAALNQASWMLPYMNEPWFGIFHHVTGQASSLVSQDETSQTREGAKRGTGCILGLPSRLPGIVTPLVRILGQVTWHASQ
jgi:hypothetical protein